MKRTYILYNSLAGNKKEREKKLRRLKAILPDKDPVCIDVLTVPSYDGFISGLRENDSVYLCGGDGTLNRFVNGIKDTEPRFELYYYGTGSGNDFLRDLNKKPGCEPFLINEYIKDLPAVTVNGKTSRFLNNVGFGIDGYCTEVGDRRKAAHKRVNYTLIALAGLLFNYKPGNATVNVDGREYRYESVWLAPTMNGRFFGGGMMVCPTQDRMNEDGEVTLLVNHDTGKLRILSVFPSVFKGKHMKHTDIIAIHRGHSISVEYDEPGPLQIDGESYSGIKRYDVKSRKAVREAEDKSDLAVTEH